MRRVVVGECSVGTLVTAAVNLEGYTTDRSVLVPRLVYLVRRVPPFQGAPTRRLLLDPSNRRELPDAWDLAYHRENGWYGFHPYQRLAFGWVSRTKARLLAIPILSREELTQGYLLELSSPQGQGSHYAAVFRNLGVQWQSGTLLDRSPIRVNPLMQA